MKILSIFASFLSIIAAETALEAFQELPHCGQICLAPVVISQNCNISTLATVSDCICTNIPALRNISDCVFANCNRTDLYNVSSQNRQLCATYPVASKSGRLIIIVASVASVAVSLLILRLVVRIKIATKLWWDDVLVFFCFLLAVNAAIVIGIVSSKGFGKHVWEVDIEQVPLILKLFYFLQLCYSVTLLLTKSSVLIFYLRIFSQKWLRNCAYAMLVFLGLTKIILITVTAFQCVPTWSIWTLEAPAKCIDRMALIYSAAGLTIFEDVLILALPIPCIASLNLTLPKKLGVGLMFAVGSFSLFTSCVRLKFLKGFSSMTDPTWDNYETVLWSHIEILSAIICASLPALRVLLRALPKPSTFSKLSKNTNTYGESMEILELHRSRNRRRFEKKTAFDVTVETVISQEERRASSDSIMEWPLSPGPMTFINENVAISATPPIIKDRYNPW